MTTTERLAAADAQLAHLLSGAATVADAARRLASDPDRLIWLPIDLRRGDLAQTLGRVSPLPAAAVIEAYQEILRAGAARASALHYAATTAADNVAALERGAPRERREDE